MAKDNKVWFEEARAKFEGARAGWDTFEIKDGMDPVLHVRAYEEWKEAKENWTLAQDAYERQLEAEQSRSDETDTRFVKDGSWSVEGGSWS
jgi:hypothetical protein